VPALSVIHSAREFACAEDTAELAAAAQARGWVTVSMKNDFRQVFPGDTP
jgi:hypothetical protein